MELKLLATTASAAGAVEVADKVFAEKFNPTLVHQVVCAYQAGGRAGTRAQKGRAEVRGGGAKPWRQKGTGNARAGTIRSPLWRGGGVVFPAKPQDFSQKVNKKMFRKALSAILAELVRQERLLVVEKFTVASPKTRELCKQLAEMQLKSGLIVVAQPETNLYLAARNLPGVKVCMVDEVTPINLIGAPKVLMTVPAVKKIEEKLA